MITYILLLLSIIRYNIPFTSCGEGALTMAKVSSNIYPFKVNEDIDITFIGYLNEQLDNDGTFKCEFKKFGMIIYTLNGKLSDLGLKFPYPSGPFNATYIANIPSKAPGGYYEVIFSANDDSNHLLF